MPNLSHDPPVEILSDPTPREVTSPWLICQAARDGMRTVVFSTVARDRTGLLRWMTDRIHEFDPSLRIDAGRAETQEDFFAAFLLIRAPGMRPRKLDEFVTVVREWADRPISGWQILVAKSISLVLEGTDRPGLMRDVCLAFDEHKIHIANFHAHTKVEFAPGLDLLAATEPPEVTPLFEMRFDLELSAQAVATFAALRRRLEQLDCTVK